MRSTAIGVVHGTPTPPTVNAFPLGRTSGKFAYSGPFQMRAMVSMMKLTPIAVISGATRGACRNGR